MTGTLDGGISRDAAFALLKEYNEDPFHTRTERPSRV